MADLTAGVILSDGVSYPAATINSIVSGATINSAAISAKSAIGSIAGTEEVLVNDAGTLKKFTTAAFKTYVSALYPINGTYANGGPLTLTTTMATVGSVTIQTVVGRNVLLFWSATTYTTTTATNMQYQVLRASDSAVMSQDLTGLALNTLGVLQNAQAFCSVLITGGTTYNLQMKVDAGTSLLRNINMISYLY